ncbi:hypothetical protein [Nocardia sp. NPDC049707]|uniref:hypothetical protein n=1 Tax=Nocardia sp. NPDC049707 TaxID=3154735 RepID=UPI0034309115
MSDDDRKQLAARALAWAKSNDGGRLGVWWPCGSKTGDGSQPIMSVLWDHGGTGELGVFYDEESADDMEIICDIFNWALEELAPSERGFYGQRTYLADEEQAA